MIAAAELPPLWHLCKYKQLPAACLRMSLLPGLKPSTYIVHEFNVLQALKPFAS